MRKTIVLAIFLGGIGLFVFSLLNSLEKDKLGIIHDRKIAIPDTAGKITPETDAYPVINHSNEYLDPIPLPGAINTAGAEDSPFIMPDGDTLYFWYTPDVSIPPEKQLIDGVTGIYKAQKKDGEWSEAKRIILQDQGKLALDGCPYVNDGTIWFCSAREGYEGMNWFIASKVEGKWQSWQEAPQSLKQHQVGELDISADGKIMFFDSAREGGMGGHDIWMITENNKIWENPVNVSAINSPANESRPQLSPDGNTLWFTRSGKGAPEVWRSIKADNEWQEPELMFSNFAGESSVDNEGNVYFTHHYYKDGIMLEADIYVSYKKK